MFPNISGNIGSDLNLAIWSVMDITAKLIFVNQRLRFNVINTHSGKPPNLNSTNNALGQISGKLHNFMIFPDIRYAMYIDTPYSRHIFHKFCMQIILHYESWTVCLLQKKRHNLNKGK